MALRRSLLRFSKSNCSSIKVSTLGIPPNMLSCLLLNHLTKAGLSDLGRIHHTPRLLEFKIPASMNLLFQEIRHNKLLWLLVFVPIVLIAEKALPEAHTLKFFLSVLAILPLAILLSHATESVSAKTGDAVGGLLNATLGNLTELVIAIAALQAGQYT